MENKKNNIKVFQDTRHISYDEYSNETLHMVHNTKYISQFWDPEVTTRGKTRADVRVVNMGTVSAAHTIATEIPRANVAVLNFADALVPGGLVLYGEVTQEENICRCSNLYEVLNSPQSFANYYMINRNYVDIRGDHNYTDAIIYSPGVVIFKDDRKYSRIKPVTVDVITCPAPCGYSKGVEDIIKKRIRKILVAAYRNGATHLVLGAWGCGAFGQDANVISSAFKDVLQDLQVFDMVVFAIRTSHDRSGSNLDIFRKTFQNIK